MAIIRQDRYNKENVISIKDIEEYINTTYLIDIQNRINELKLKKEEIINKLALYNSLNSSNNNTLQAITTNSKYTTIINNQVNAEALLQPLNLILKELNLILLNKDKLTLLNLLTKQDASDNNKVNEVDGEFITLQGLQPTTIKGAINKEYLDNELSKLIPLPTPYIPLKPLRTNNQGNLTWN